MAPDKTRRLTRSERILQELNRKGAVRVDDLAAALGVSAATIRRDLSRLAKAGRLHRTHGGAVLSEPLLYEPFRHDSRFQDQVERFAGEKRRIGAAAAQLIEEGDTIALTPGTTTTQVARCIPSRQGLMVITSTVNVAMELANRSELKVFVTGGFLRGRWFSLVGAAAARAMSQFFVDKVFIGVNGIDAERGLTAYDPDEAAFNQVMVGQARRRIVVADHSKLGAVATCLICLTGQVDLLITDRGAPEEAVAPFREKGIEVQLV